MLHNLLYLIYKYCLWSFDALLYFTIQNTILKIFRLILCNCLFIVRTYLHRFTVRRRVDSKCNNNN